MATASQLAPVSNKMLWTGRVVSIVIGLLLLADGVGKLAKPEPVVKATTKLGYPESVIVGLGIVLIACTAIYLIPRTALLGAILLTGYLGGAVASHLRAGDAVFPICFPVIVGAVVWGGLWLRDGRLRALVPLRTL
ncbi:MAG TPA: DoxX family protein [Gemmataceae bacterium]